MWLAETAVARIFLAVVLIFLLSWLSKWWRRWKLGLPPGPTGWPILGYIEFILSQKPSKLLLKDKEKYGNVFGFYVGKQYCVVLNDFASVKEAFGKKAMLARPPKYLRTSAEFKNFVEMDYEYWDIHRKFIISSLTYLGVGSSRLEDVIHEELSRVIAKLEKDVGKPECNIRSAITASFNNAIFQLVCSKWFEDDHPVMIAFDRMQTLVAESFSNNIALIYFPWLDWILSRVHPHYKAVGHCLTEMTDFLKSEIESRQKTHNESSTHDYIDLYLNELKSKKHDPEQFNMNHLAPNSAMMLVAGSDTTRNTVEWALMCLAQFPDIQEKVFTELQSVVGTEKRLCYADRALLPYTEATILESERWKTLAPLNVLRLTTEDTVVQGYTIPKETIVMHNLDFCHMDPKYWKNPEEFIPERFLNNDKTKVIVPEYFMPFSIGKRNCPGAKLASIEVFLHCTTILQKFKVLPPPGGVCLTGQHRINFQADRPVLKIQYR